MKRKRVISLIMTVALLMAAIPLNTFADEKVLTDIDIVKNEQAVNYKGQPFNSSSICVTAIYDDGSSSFISDEEYDIANYNSDKAGQVEITIAYGGLSKDVLIDITDSDFLYPIGKEVSLSVMSGTDAVAFWKSSDENIF
ncbi:MAG: bacterial Ig-like domain-containing protein [Anaerovoracaceae bacterium]|nr:bacterial Ig-like domain-containing protein [Anaerovoracaceae bacterium]